MKPADYKCICENVITLYIPDTQKFPDDTKCKVCGRMAKRKYTPAYPIVRQGRVGNYKNGYKSNNGYVKKS